MREREKCHLECTVRFRCEMRMVGGYVCANVNVCCSCYAFGPERWSLWGATATENTHSPARAYTKCVPKRLCVCWFNQELQLEQAPVVFELAVANTK